jgi:hypothetical protein
VRVRLCSPLPPGERPGVRVLGSSSATLPPREGIKEFADQYLILVTCRDEKEQVELLSRFTAEGLQCKALVG